MARAKQFNLPDPGEGLTEAEIVTWKVKVGDTVKVNDIVVEIETAKSLVELPVAVRRHGDRRCSCAEGETVEVGTPIIAVDTGARRRPAPRRRHRPVAARRPSDEEIEAGKIGGAAPGGRTAVLVGYGATDDRGQAPPPQGRRRRRHARRTAAPRAPRSAPARPAAGTAPAPASRRSRSPRRAGGRSRRWPSRRCASSPRTSASTSPT